MIAFERRQRILRVLYDQPGIRVPEVAKAVGVTEATIRSDLRVLEQEQKLRRVRGGAVLADPVRSAYAATVQPQPPIAQPIEDALGMGRWAAQMVQDGDTLYLDESEWALAMVPGLSQRRDLMVITNHVEAARRLAADTDHRVLLLGGLLQGGGTYTDGQAGEAVPAGGLLTPSGIRARFAFVGATGFSAEMGATESGPSLAIKRAMAEAAEQVVVFVAARALGKNAGSVFAPPTQVHALITGADATRVQLDGLRGLDLAITLCGAGSVTTFAPDSRHPTYRIGFANLSEDILFSVEVRRGLERAARQHANIDLVTADNRLSGERALENAGRFIEEKVDLVIEYQLDAAVGAQIMNRYQRAGIPVIAVDIPMVGATYFGVNNIQAGLLAGHALGRWIRDEWGGLLDRLFIIEEPRAGALPAGRIHGQIQGLEEVLGPIPEAKRVWLEGGNTSTASEVSVARALAESPADRRIAVICFTDDAAVGALRAARALSREQDVAVVGQGADRTGRAEIARPASRLVGSTAFLPEQYGERLIELALRILRGESVPPAVFMDHIFIDRAALAAGDAPANEPLPSTIVPTPV